MREVDASVDDTGEYSVVAIIPSLPGRRHLYASKAPLLWIAGVIGSVASSINIHKEVWFTAGNACKEQSVVLHRCNPWCFRGADSVMSGTLSFDNGSDIGQSLEIVRFSC